MTDRTGTITASEQPAAADWVGGLRSHAVAWGLPILVLLATGWLGHPLQSWAWGGALAWMGLACVANAMRCGRTHCYVTGPFYLAMALASVLHGHEVLWLGPRGWLWLGIAAAAASALLWVLSESVWGRYRSLRKG